MTERVRGLAFASTLVLLVGTIVLLQVVRDARFPLSPVDDRLLYVTSGDVARKLSLSYDALIADVYWIRAIQHYGGELGQETERRYDLLYPLLDLTTSLDPRFSVAYRFGATFLMEPYPIGASRPDLAIKLLEKGIRESPQHWEYYLDIGFIYYWRLNDYKRAAEWFQRGGELPNGPWWLRTQAAVTLARGGDRQASRFLWTNIYAGADNDWMKQNAERRLLQLDALDHVDGLVAVIREYQRRRGALPRSWTDLVGAGLLRSEPVDPSGTPYILNAETGQPNVSNRSKLWPLPVEPPVIAAPVPSDSQQVVP
jgi:tetratricopeptide (TPR) repeat protein